NGELKYALQVGQLFASGGCDFTVLNEDVYVRSHSPWIWVQPGLPDLTLSVCANLAGSEFWVMESVHRNALKIDRYRIRAGAIDRAKTWVTAVPPMLEIDDRFVEAAVGADGSLYTTCVV